MVDVNQVPNCLDLTSKRADARPCTGNPESLAAKQNQVDVTGGTPDWKGVNISLPMKFSSTMKPAAPVGWKVCQGMTHKKRWREGAECSKSEIMFHIHSGSATIGDKQAIILAFVDFVDAYLFVK